MFKKIVILILFLVGATVLNANQDNINDTKTEKVDQKKGSSKNSQKKDENILEIPYNNDGKLIPILVNTQPSGDTPLYFDYTIVMDDKNNIYVNY